jgi:hypothetical protein
LMRTGAIMSLRHIAVPTKRLQPVRVPHCSYPSVEWPAPNCSPRKLAPMRVPATIYMVKRQERRVAFTTTGTLMAIVVEYILFELVHISSIAGLKPFWIRFPPGATDLGMVLYLVWRALGTSFGKVLLATRAFKFVANWRVLATAGAGACCFALMVATLTRASHIRICSCFARFAYGSAWYYRPLLAMWADTLAFQLGVAGF